MRLQLIFIPQRQVLDERIVDVSKPAKTFDVTSEFCALTEDEQGNLRRTGDAEAFIKRVLGETLISSLHRGPWTARLHFVDQDPADGLSIDDLEAMIECIDEQHSSDIEQIRRIDRQITLLRRIIRYKNIAATQAPPAKTEEK